MELHAVLEETMNDEHDDIKSVSFANQEEELLAALGSNKLEDEDLRKRYVMRLFDRFRMEYTSISMRLRDSLRNQRQIMEKVSSIYLISSIVDDVNKSFVYSFKK
jgi:hypothetical protein